MLWLCPKCSHARPNFIHGRRGKLAASYCDAINYARKVARRTCP